MNRMNFIEGILKNTRNIISVILKKPQKHFYRCFFCWLSKHGGTLPTAQAVPRHCPWLCKRIRDSSRLFLLPLLWSYFFSSNFSGLHRPCHSRFLQLKPTLSHSGPINLSMGLVLGIPATSKLSFLALVLYSINPAQPTPWPAQVLALLARVQAQNGELHD